MKTALKTAPTTYPVTLKQVKEHLNITVGWTEDDNILQALIKVATNRAEQFLRRRLITQTWYAYYNKWPDEDYFILPFGKLQTTVAPIIKYTDTDSTQTTWSATEWNADNDADPGRIVLEYGYNWPTTTLHPQNPIVIEFVCGYGDSGSDVEVSIIHAIKIMIDDLYTNRGDMLIGVSMQNLKAAKDLLMPYRLHNVLTQ
jgi:uncharacterized phiE125 gp8 family phage protein